MIEGHRFHLSIEETDEEVMRRGVKQLQEKLNEMAIKYKSSAFERLAMTGIMLAIENEEQRLQARYSAQSIELEELTASVKRALED